MGKLYAADLIGAAAGCLVLFTLLNITDGPSAVILVGSFACAGSAVFASAWGQAKLKRAAIFSSALFFALAITNTVLGWNQSAVLRPLWIKGNIEQPGLYEKWNTFSRIRISGDPNTPQVPFGWGFSPAYDFNDRIQQLNLKIDGNAGTTLTKFDGDLALYNYLRYDITNLAHHLRSHADVLVVGSGGGRDILLFNSARNRSSGLS